MSDDHSQIREAFDRLHEALAGGDDAKVREAADELARIWKSADGAVETSLRLIDLGQIAAELIHEFRQPLVGVKAFAQMIVAHPERTDSVRSHADHIVAQANRMAEFVERAERYIRHSGGAGYTTEIDLHDLIGESLDLLRHRLSRSDIQVESRFDGDVPTVNADPFTIQQVVINLVCNALDALDATGGKVTVWTESEPTRVCVYVRDDGPGVPEQMRSRLFDKFATSKENGIGLGLHMCRRHARDAGGDLEFLADLDETTFRLTLPPSGGTDGAS